MLYYTFIRAHVKVNFVKVNFVKDNHLKHEKIFKCCLLFFAAAFHSYFYRTLYLNYDPVIERSNAIQGVHFVYSLSICQGKVFSCLENSLL